MRGRGMVVERTGARPRQPPPLGRSGLGRACLQPIGYAPARAASFSTASRAVTMGIPRKLHMGSRSRLSPEAEIGLAEPDGERVAREHLEQPGMGYLSDLAEHSGVHRRRIKLALVSWDDMRAGLTPASYVGVVGPKRLPRGLDEFDVFAQQGIDELTDLDAAGLGASREVGLHIGVEVDRQIRRGVRLEELATDALGEVDLGGHVVVMRLGLRSHGVHLSLRPQVAAVIVGHRGSFSYGRRSPRVASRAEMILTLAVSDPVAV